MFFWNVIKKFFGSLSIVGVIKGKSQDQSAELNGSLL